MSGRIRTIKPEILEDAETAALSHEAWRLYVSSYLLADDYGNFRAHPKQLDGAVFWLRESRDTLASVAELAQVGLWHLYELRGQLYVSIRNWEKHQKVDHPGKPRVPGPNDSDAKRIIPGTLEEFRETVAKLARTPSAGVAPDLRPPTSTTDPDHQHVPKSTGFGELVKTVFGYWVEKRSKDPKRTRLTTQRRHKVEQRLREGYTVEDLKAAIDGVARSPHHCGENDSGTVYDDLELICRNGGNVERFRDMPANGARARASPQLALGQQPAAGVTGYEKARIVE